MFVVEKNSEQFFFMNNHPTFFVEVVFHPQIVVAHKQMKFYAPIAQFAQFSQKPCKAARHHISIFMPKVKHVTEHIYGFGLVFYRVEKCHEAFLVATRVFESPRTKVGIRNEIYVSF